MLYVNIMRATSASYSMPPEQRARLLSAQAVYIDKYVKMGKFKYLYCSIDLKNFIIVWEAETGEEAARIFSEAPLARYMDIEVLPCVDYDTWLKVMAEAAKKTAAN